MRVLRLMVAGLMAGAAMVGVLFVAAAVFLAGLVALVVQLVRGNAAPARAGRAPAASRRPVTIRPDEVIDVDSTRLPSDPAGG
jgi:hypothetical protein